GTCVETRRRTGGFGQPQSSTPLVPPRLIQPKQPQILPKLSSGSANMTTPSAAATTRSQSLRAAQHKATPRPAPVPAPQPATTVQRGAAMGAQHRESAAHREPRGSAAGHVSGWTCARHFPAEPVHSGPGPQPDSDTRHTGADPELSGTDTGVQLALRPPHATGLTLGRQTGPRPHGEHPGPPGTPTLVIPQNLGPRPNIFLALPRMMSPPLVCHSPGTATDAATAAGHAAHADHAGPAHTGREDVPAEGQTPLQRAARLFKTCDDVVAQETDYVPRIRGYMHDANLHWPQHPAIRDHSAVDVLSSMLQISDKWGWPCFFEFYTRGSSDSFELTVHPTVHLEQFKYNAVKLGVGVTGSSEMMDFEAEILDPALTEFFSPPETYVFERDRSDVFGMWERWTSAIARHYNLTGNEQIETVANNRQYFQLILHLVATKEEVLELVIGWLCVQYTSWFANRELIANFYGYPENADLRHRRVCLAFTISLTGIALLVPFVQGVYTEPVRKDAWGITRAVRRTVYQTLDEATYPWHEITSLFRFLDIAVVHDLEARFAHFPEHGGQLREEPAGRDQGQPPNEPRLHRPDRPVVDTG
ncbi:hypothetical protein MRX96_052409, partial [Rhipicephalus microplus]